MHRERNPRNEVNNEVEKVAARHGLGNSVITTLTLRGLGGYGACRSVRGWSFQSYKLRTPFPVMHYGYISLETVLHDEPISPLEAERGYASINSKVS